MFRHEKFVPSGVEPATRPVVAYSMMKEDQPVPTNWRTNAIVARIVGIVSIALGFILGMYGLDEQGSRWLQTALGLLVTGMLAQGYALYCSVKRMQELHDQSKT